MITNNSNIVRDEDYTYVIGEICLNEYAYIYEDIIDDNIIYEMSDILDDIIFDNICPLINGIIYPLDEIHKLYDGFINNLIKLMELVGPNIHLECANYIRNRIEYLESLCLEFQMYETLQNIKNFREKNTKRIDEYEERNK